MSPSLPLSSLLPQTLAATTVATMNSLLCSLTRDALVHQGTTWGGYATEKVIGGSSPYTTHSVVVAYCFTGLDLYTEALVCVCIDNWLKLDDDKVSMVKEEDILKLSGGGKSLELPSTLSGGGTI